MGGAASGGSSSSCGAGGAGGGFQTATNAVGAQSEIAGALAPPDETTVRSWIYPTNYAVRRYQEDLVRAALFDNTLVSLPTGLGKTFIGAVVMFNFYRWFPTGQVCCVSHKYLTSHALTVVRLPSPP